MPTKEFKNDAILYKNIDSAFFKDPVILSILFCSEYEIHLDILYKKKSSRLIISRKELDLISKEIFGRWFIEPPETDFYINSTFVDWYGKKSRIRIIQFSTEYFVFNILHDYFILKGVSTDT